MGACSRKEYTWGSRIDGGREGREEQIIQLRENTKLKGGGLYTSLVFITVLFVLLSVRITREISKMRSSFFINYIISASLITLLCVWLVCQDLLDLE